MANKGPKAKAERLKDLLSRFQRLQEASNDANIRRLISDVEYELGIRWRKKGKKGKRHRG